MKSVTIKNNIYVARYGGVAKRRKFIRLCEKRKYDIIDEKRQEEEKWKGISREYREKKWK